MGKKEKNREKKHSLRERIADGLDVSKEIILNSVKMVFIGDREVTIENYKGIVEYTGTKVVIEANPWRLKIEGKELELKAVSQDLLYITGEITKTEFQKEA